MPYLFRTRVSVYINHNFVFDEKKPANPVAMLESVQPFSASDLQTFRHESEIIVN
jgi:hypothetical protein